MKLIPAGTFTMGAVPEDPFQEGDEVPIHTVTFTNAWYFDQPRLLNKIILRSWA